MFAFRRTRNQFYGYPFLIVELIGIRWIHIRTEARIYLFYQLSLYPLE